MNFVIVLSFVAALLALVAAALALVGVRAVRSRAAAVPELQEKVKILEARVADFEKKLTEMTQPPRQAPAKKAPANPWDDFLADYNLLAASLDGPQQGQEACDRFFALRSLKGLICLDPTAKQDDGKPAPKFVEVGQAGKSNFWAWPMDRDAARYAVVPNPLKGYTKSLHEKSGMKETFASDYAGQDAARIQAKLPAIFTAADGQWTIVQPGIVKLLEE